MHYTHIIKVSKFVLLQCLKSKLKKMHIERVGNISEAFYIIHICISILCTHNFRYRHYGGMTIHLYRRNCK